jgi:type I restriction enzyme M protein
MLVEDQKLDAVVKLPGGVFRPYAGVSTAILLFTKTNSGGTDQVWFYDVQADGWSLDDKRTPLLPEDKLGPVPSTALGADDHAKNNLPDVLARWRSLSPSPLVLIVTHISGRWGPWDRGRWGRRRARPA